MHDPVRIGQLFPSQAPLGVKPAARSGTNPGGFKQLLDETELRFSHHAELRMKQRGITLKPEQLESIKSAIDQAEAKGAKDSLVVMQDLAMIVNVPSRTVVTAMSGQSMQHNVFTQIDSAVVIS
ncbi:TIGR02530 family flagellar biosynthesis protein [Paenibacillus daejeonensis]|uniref:TIGR02530 family flagellar biosynthesis protein n=1 Tax=Paenibacillus daejeonensis TaxID=135193 RepID=UPI000379FC82|nr:TIGR02530 family flagellar biosynthesis protein [Paenibacillus daejeonensis]